MEFKGKSEVREFNPAPAQTEIPPEFFTRNRDGLSNFDKVELEKAEKMIARSVDFIKDNAETPVEVKTAETLTNYFNSNSVKLYDSGGDNFGAFRPRENKIYIDVNCALEDGTAELVDTLFHEAYHAAQHKAGNRNDIVKDETKAWNLGLDMSNKYRAEHGETIVRTRPYTESEMANKGYKAWEGYSGFVEIAKEVRA